MSEMGMFKNKKGVPYKETPKPTVSYGELDNEPKTVKEMKEKMSTISINRFILYKLNLLADINNKKVYEYVEDMIEKEVENLKGDDKLLFEMQLKKLYK